MIIALYEAQRSLRGAQRSPYAHEWRRRAVKEKDMVVTIDDQTAKEWKIVCYKCYGFGHKGNECVYNTTMARLICPLPGCGKQHHPRDCYKDNKTRASTATTDKAQAPVESTDKAQAPGTTSQPTPSAATGPGRDEQAKKKLQASRDFKKAMRKMARGEDEEEDTQDIDDAPATDYGFDTGPSDGAAWGAGASNAWNADGKADRGSGGW